MISKKVCSDTDQTFSSGMHFKKMSLKCVPLCTAMIFECFQGMPQLPVELVIDSIQKNNRLAWNWGAIQR